ncbi:extensin family protein [Salipiger sp. PrR002]|uniref:extensin-like domain-containing protein n=1 Tax=Salipiger sp. PrR002 TaxID=2706489 RepID=UPI0013B5BC02|nr:extensin family protein [Salipiger sp. PrR002]NDV98974.1 extensin family protein [Salipiger sp. PrR002]NDW55927.1 extensin family protein [Salipiger sp. PrR004]
MIARAMALAALMLLASPLGAAPETSLRPVERMLRQAPEPAAPPVVTGNGTVQRKAPNAGANSGTTLGTNLPPALPALAFAARSPQAIGNSLRPLRRSQAVIEKALALRKQRQRGAVCGDPELQGTPIGNVPGRINGCGITDAIKLRSVSGLSLSTRATIDCTTARALKTWVDTAVKPAVGSTGGGVKGLRVAASYACRARNNQPGAKISEHGKGRAIDISAIQLRDGSEISVLRDWGGGSRGRILRSLHSDACGPFGTVLGPESDRFHQDHFHFDTARYRAGTYCR